MLGIISVAIGAATFMIADRTRPVTDPDSTEPPTDRFTHGAVPAAIAMLGVYLIGYTAGF